MKPQDLPLELENHHSPRSFLAMARPGPSRFKVILIFGSGTSTTYSSDVGDSFELIVASLNSVVLL